MPYPQKIPQSLHESQFQASDTSQYLQKQLSQMKSTSDDTSFIAKTMRKCIFQATRSKVHQHSKSDYAHHIQQVTVQINIIYYFVSCIILTFPLLLFRLPSIIKYSILFTMYSIPFLYFYLVFFDAGSLFQDQDQNFQQERIFCTTCKLYKNMSTRHCIYCKKCCKKYDHHCSVFGKCIGKRNLWAFYGLLSCVGVTFMGYFGSGLAQITVKR